MTIELYRDFRLKVDGDGWLLPGKPLSGAVIVPQRFIGRKTPLKVHVLLRGRTEVLEKMDTSRRQVERPTFCPLLYEVCQLEPSEEREWRFSFAVPAEIREVPNILQLEKLYEKPKLKQGTSPWVHKWLESDNEEFRNIFNNLRHQPLPPTYHTVTSKGSWDLWVSVRYRVAAFVMRPPPEDSSFSYRELLGLKSKKAPPAFVPLQVCERVLVIPGSNEEATPENLDKSTHLAETLRYSPKKANVERSRILSHVTSTKDADMQDLDVDIAIPQVLEPDKPVNIAVSISPESGADLSMLELELQQLRVTVRRLTYVHNRASHLAFNSCPLSWSSIILDQVDDVVKDQLLEWQESQTGDSRKIKTVNWSAGPLKKQEPGTFKTLNIACSYHVSVELKLACNGRSTKVRKASAVTMAAGQGESMYKGGLVTQADAHTTGSSVALEMLGLIADVVSSTTS